MKSIYETIIQLIKPGKIASAAATLGESEQKVSSSVDTILPSLLARVLKKGNTNEIRSIVEDAGKLNIHRDYKQIWEGNGIFDGKNIGERMENQLLGVENPTFYSAVAAHTGIKKESADRLTNWVAATIAANFGEKIAAGRSYDNILSELGSEKEGLQKGIPSSIINSLGLGSALGIPAVAKATKKIEPKIEPKKGKKKSWAWLWWLLGIILLALAAFLLFRSCGSCKKEPAVVNPVEQVAQTAIVAPGSVNPEIELSEGMKMILPDGQKVTVYKEACEECMEAFLKSDKFKTATEAQLKTVWFMLDNVSYEHNSATEFMTGGEAQIQRVAEILKRNPQVNVRIGAFADATGSNAVNYKITEKRAKHIEQEFEKAGIKAPRISTEGFGEQYANIPANASDTERAIDRDIALRFTK